jgi:hypothetical protein
VGSKWEAVIFRGDPGVMERIADDAINVAGLAANPIQVMLHIMPASGDWTPLAAGEFTAFSRRPLPVTSSAVKALNTSIFGATGLSFRHAEILLAQRISEIMPESLYVYWNDTYNAAGYVAFQKGQVGPFEVSGWEGSATYVSDGAGGHSDREHDALLRRGFGRMGWRLPDTVDDLLDVFYRDAGQSVSYVLIERGLPVSPPVRR